MVITTYLSRITLNVNGLNAPIKRHRVVEWVRKKRPLPTLPTRDWLQIERHAQTESQGKYFHTSWK